MIPAEIVEETWERMSQTRVSEAPQVVQRMRKEQPVIVSDIFSLVDSPFNDHERTLIAYIGIVVWEIMQQSDKRLLKVTRRKLNRAKEANQAEWEMLAADTGADFVSATMARLESYPEPEVLRYVFEAIVEEENYAADGPPIRAEHRGLAFLHLKIILDAFVNSLA
jgi:predicted TIM-barrel fold metal-dependent hydrolase